jgi:hypothetical protein
MQREDKERRAERVGKVRGMLPKMRVKRFQWIGVFGLAARCRMRDNGLANTKRSKRVGGMIEIAVRSLLEIGEGRRRRDSWVAGKTTAEGSEF